jgi:thiamine biosynthesis protein ThiI
MRRMMYRIAERMAKRRDCLAIVNGESVGQVASQTLTSMSVINNVTNMPVIRPVACLDKLEIMDIARKIDTYETSILPYEDCCTVFVPKHPVINPILKLCEEMEQRFNYEELIKEALSNVKSMTIREEDNTEEYNELL